MYGSNGWPSGQARMSGYAPSTVVVIGTSDEAFLFSRLFKMDDGSDFPFHDYEIQYAIRGNDGFSLDLNHDNSGVTVTNSAVTFGNGEQLAPGRYSHGCRLRHIISGHFIQVFDGLVLIERGAFA